MGYVVLTLCFIVILSAVLMHFWDRVDELERRNKYQAREIKILEEKANKYKWAAERYTEILRAMKGR